MKTKNRKLAVAALLLLGVATLSGAFWSQHEAMAQRSGYRSYSRSPYYRSPYGTQRSWTNPYYYGGRHYGYYSPSYPNYNRGVHPYYRYRYAYPGGHSYYNRYYYRY